jgi:undecaprenyl-diphosphatase
MNVDTLVQAIVMGLVQGLTEFLPVSSSGHLIVVPALLGWDDPFIESLAFSVMLHLGTLVALLVFFRADWLRLIPAWFGSLRDRSIGGDPDRRLAWLLAISTIPAVIAGLVLNDIIETAFREVRLVAVTLVVGGVILWLAERVGRRNRTMGELSPAAALGIGAAQAVALVPGISRSGISISAGLFAGLDRESAARFSFLMATPITAGAGLYEARKLVTGEAGIDVPLIPLAAGMIAALIAGLASIAILLRFLRTHPTTVFVVYRVVLAAVVVVAWLGLWDRPV